MSETLETNYPKVFRIVGTIRAPEGVTSKDVIKAIQRAFRPLNITEIKEIS